MYPGDATVGTIKGVALHALKRYEEAIAAYDRALAIDPSNKTAPDNRILALENVLHSPEKKPLEHGARVTTKDRIPPVYEAAKMQYERLVRTLLAEGANANEPFELDLSGGSGGWQSILPKRRKSVGQRDS
ncbi:MAG: tetratricopeptide repeat protein [Bryobacteraceae bacterium]|jgi:tetratricopeptide (TPR) repeat protein